MNYVDSLIAEAVKKTHAAKILDIGCGVGGSMLYMARHTSCNITGITISPVQQKIGKRLLDEEGYTNRTTIMTGDFTDQHISEVLDTPYNAAYAIESFLHMGCAEEFFFQTAQVLHQGGELFICDDVLRSKLSVASEDLVQRFRCGWHVQSLYSPTDLQVLAEKQGLKLKEKIDLSAYLELNRPRDMLIRRIVGLLGRFKWRNPFWENLIGGDALQQLILNGDIGYMLLRFVK